MNLQDPADFMRRKQSADRKPEAKPEIAKPAAKAEPEAKPEEGNKLTITVSKTADGFHSSIDAGDGFPPDEADFKSLPEVYAAASEKSTEVFGEPANAPAAEPAAEEMGEGEAMPMANMPKMMRKGGFMGKFGAPEAE